VGEVRDASGEARELSSLTAISRTAERRGRSLEDSKNKTVYQKQNIDFCELDSRTSV
jgi:hypothetical protein